MGKINLDIISKKFNMLTVLEFIGLNKNNAALFLCRCDCDNEKILLGKEVKSGKIKSCGCYIATIKEKNCTICGEIFQPTGRCSKFCKNCESIGTEITKQKCSRNYRYRKAIENNTLERYGAGKGGSQLKGKESPNYKNGIKYFHDRSKEIKEERRYCEKCNKDLKDSKNGFWCVHHIDHNRNNNDESNFKLLCKKCHQIEHKCWKSFNKELL